MPSSVAKDAQREPRVRRVIKASNARLPPSPRLSARIMNSVYITATTSLSAQKISERIPRICALTMASGWAPMKHSLTAYSAACANVAVHDVDGAVDQAALGLVVFVI